MNRDKRIRILPVLILICSMILGIVAPAASVRASSSAHRKVRVGYEYSPRFAEGKNDGDMKAGYAYEYLQKLAAYTGWEYEYVYGSLSDIFEMLKSGEVDVMPGISYTREREEYISYPDTPMGYESYYIYSDSEKSFAKDGGESIAGAVIGCNRGFTQAMALEEWNAEQGNICRIISFDSDEEMFEALSMSMIDGCVDVDNSVLSERGMVPVIKVGSADYYLAVSQASPEILGELNDALNEIAFEDPYMTETLHNKYYNDSAFRMPLRADEEEWLKAHSTIRIGYEKDFLAFCGYDETTRDVSGALKAFIDDAEADYAEYGIRLEPVMLADVEEAMEALKNGTVDAIFPVYESLYAAENEGLFITDRLAGTAMTAIIGDYNTFDESDANIVAVVKGFKDIYWYLAEYYPGWRILECDDFSACLYAVQNGVADCIVESTYVYRNQIGDSKLDTVSLSRSANVAFAVRREDTMLLTIMNRMIRTSAEEDIVAALTRYSNQENRTLGDYVRDNLAMVFGLCALIVFTFFLLVLRSASAREQTVVLNRQLMEKQQELQQALDDSKAAAAAKTAFLSRMSHDIRTPLNGIIGLIEIGERHADDRQLIDENREKAKVAANHLLSLISDVLDLTKMDDESVQLAREPFNILEMAEDVMTITEMRAVESGITISHTDATAKIAKPYVFGSPLHVRQIFLNILGNAIKYNKPHGSIHWDAETVEVTDTTVIYRVTISDTGIGMSPEFVEHIFEPFTQEHSDARSVYQGTGLGMAIVKSMIDKMKGTIEVSSVEGEGSTFVVTLPFEIASEADMPKQDAVEMTDLDGMKILLVEDNELNMEIAEAILEDLGAVITEARNGQEAVDIFRNSPAGTFDVILMDLMMPVMDGYAATGAIRALDRADAKEIAIVAMTANAFAEDVAKCLAAGMNAHLSKPIDIPRLLTTLGGIRGRVKHSPVDP